MLMVIAAMAISSMLTVAVLETIQTSPVATDDRTSDRTGASRDKGVQSATDSLIPEDAGLTEDEWNKLQLVFQVIDSSFYEEVDREKLIDGAIRGMVSALDDPYTSYMNATEAEQFTATVDSTFSGIGAEVTMLDGQVTVVAAIKDSPAERAGILARDVILSVNNESLAGLTLDEAVAKIRGPKGTQAKLEVLREGNESSIQIIVVRDDIDLETVFARMEDDAIGVIELRQFVQNSDTRFEEEFKQLQEQGMQALIIDVRDNPGGYLYSVLDLLDFLLDNGEKIVQVVNRDGESRITYANGEGVDLPIAVLMNEGSASASEILATALQENGKAKLFGATTFGKGTVQSSYSKGFQDGSNMKITIAKWLTPSGRFIHGTGVDPDVEVKLPDYFNVAPLPKDVVLERNQNNAATANLQLMLRTLGYEIDREDGYFSEETEKAVKQFQLDSGLEETGLVDKETAEKLESAMIEHLRDPLHDTQLQSAMRYLKQTLGIDL